MKNHYLNLIIMFLGILAGCSRGSALGPESAEFLATAAEDDCGFIQNSLGQRVSWKQNLPITIKISSDFNEDYRQEIKSAATVWNSLVQKKLFEIEIVENLSSEYNGNDNQNIIYISTTWEESLSNQQAVTILKYKGPLIYEADIKLNFKDFIFYIDQPESYKEIHFKSLIIHELGHVLGLKHSINKPTVMWSTLSANYLRTQVSNTDQQSLRCEYE